MMRICCRWKVLRAIIVVLFCAIALLIYKVSKSQPASNVSINLPMNSSEAKKISEWHNVLDELNSFFSQPPVVLPNKPGTKWRFNQAKMGLHSIRQFLNELIFLRQNRLASEHVFDVLSRAEKIQEGYTKNPNQIVIFTWPFKNRGKQTFYDDRSMPCWGCAEPKVKSCLFTSNTELFTEAEAVVLVASDITTANMPPRIADQKWIFFSRESPNHVLLSGVKLQNFDNMFNATATYMRDSDIVIAYGTCSQKPASNEAMTWSDIKDYVRAYFWKKKQLAAWFVSSCYTQSRRENYVVKLKAYINTYIYGFCGTYSCPASEKECLDMLSRDYFFYFSFENSLCKDYVTEKVFKIFHHNIAVIPVVMGGANYSQLLPPYSFINVADYSSPKQLADYLIYLAHNATAYIEYFRWKEHYECKIESSYFLPICNYLHATRHQPSTIPSIHEKFSFATQCYGTREAE